MATIEIPDFWTFHMECSCPFGSVRADQGDIIIATEEQAWQNFYEGDNRGRVRAVKSGCYVAADAVFDFDRWKQGHDHPDCSRPKEVTT